MLLPVVLLCVPPHFMSWYTVTLLYIQRSQLINVLPFDRRRLNRRTSAMSREASRFNGRPPLRMVRGPRGRQENVVIRLSPLGKIVDKCRNMSTHMMELRGSGGVEISFKMVRDLKNIFLHYYTIQQQILHNEWRMGARRRFQYK